jgi:hypothetical protein
MEWLRFVVPPAYLVVMGVYFYLWKEDAADRPFGLVLFIVLLLVHVAVGAAIGAWWAVALPFAAILVAVPFGYGEGVGQEAPIWLYYGYVLALPAAVVVALGVGARKLVSRRPQLE